MDYQKLSKMISYALMHHPRLNGLKLDDEGWASAGTGRYIYCRLVLLGPVVNGVYFYKEDNNIWLSGHIPSCYIKILK